MYHVKFQSQLLVPHARAGPWADSIASRIPPDLSAVIDWSSVALNNRKGGSAGWLFVCLVALLCFALPFFALPYDGKRIAALDVDPGRAWGERGSGGERGVASE